MEYRIFIIDQRTYTEHFLGGFNDLWAMRRAVDRLQATIDPACTVEVRSPSGLIVHWLTAYPYIIECLYNRQKGAYHGY